MFTKTIGPIFRFLAKAICVGVVIPGLWLLEPFWRIRLGLVYTQRIGHLASNTDAFLRRRQLNGTPARTSCFLFGYDPANRQLFKMFQRKAPIFESRWGTRLLFAWRPLLENTRFWEPFDWRTKRFHLMNHTKGTLRFTEEEEARGLAALEEMGVGREDWFVCFHSRDGSYLRQWRPEHNEVWDRTDFKNSSLQNYIPAARHVTSMGGYAIRMGAVVDAPLDDTGDPRIIDYATKFRSDFMDIYLAAKCRFFLGSSSGLNMVPMIFDVPVAIPNHFPHTHGYYHAYDLFTLRLITCRNTGRLVNFPEATKAGFYANSNGSSLADKDYEYEWRENDPEDILDLCKDMFAALNGELVSAKTKKMQDLYAETYLSHHPDYRYAAKVGPRFLDKYRGLVFDKPEALNPVPIVKTVPF